MEVSFIIILFLGWGLNHCQSQDSGKIQAEEVTEAIKEKIGKDAAKIQVEQVPEVFIKNISEFWDSPDDSFMIEYENLTPIWRQIKNYLKEFNINRFITRAGKPAKKISQGIVPFIDDIKGKLQKPNRFILIHMFKNTVNNA